MEKSTGLKSISEFTLEQLFPKTLTDITCVCIDKGSEVWLATEMCAHYTESVVDSLVIRENGKSIGTVGGYDLLDHLRKNPTRNFQYHHKVEEIMFSEIPQIDRKAKLKDLIQQWKNSRRAFAIITNEVGENFPISARKTLENVSCPILMVDVEK